MHPKRFVSTSPHPFDCGEGLLFYLGSNCGRAPYDCKYLLEHVIVSSDSVSFGSPLNIAGHPGQSEFATLDNPERHWIQISFRNFGLAMTNYALRHGSDPKGSLRNWNLLGRRSDRGPWKVIMEHKDDRSLNGQWATKVWQVPCDGDLVFFTQFRFVCTGPVGHMAQSWAIRLSGIEMFGFLSPVADLPPASDAGEIGSWDDDMAPLSLTNSVSAPGLTA